VLLSYASVTRVTWHLLLSLSNFVLASHISFQRGSLKLKEKSGHFELSGVRRMIGYIMMLAKMQLSAIYA